MLSTVKWLHANELGLLYISPKIILVDTICELYEDCLLLPKGENVFFLASKQGSSCDLHLAFAAWNPTAGYWGKNISK